MFSLSNVCVCIQMCMCVHKHTVHIYAHVCEHMRTVCTHMPQTCACACVHAHTHTHDALLFLSQPGPGSPPSALAPAPPPTPPTPRHSQPDHTGSHWAWPWCSSESFILCTALSQGSQARPHRHGPCTPSFAAGLRLPLSSPCPQGDTWTPLCPAAPGSLTIPPWLA